MYIYIYKVMTCFQMFPYKTLIYVETIKKKNYVR